MYENVSRAREPLNWCMRIMNCLCIICYNIFNQYMIYSSPYIHTLIILWSLAIFYVTDVGSLLPKEGFLAENIKAPIHSLQPGKLASIHHAWKGPLFPIWCDSSSCDPGGVTLMFHKLSKIFSKFLYCWNCISDENFKPKLCTCAQIFSMKFSP